MRVLSLACALAVASLGTAAAQTTSTTTTKKAPAAKAAPSAAARTIQLTGDDKMKYDVTELTAKPGETLHIVLKNVGTMPKMAMAHNFVLLKAGTDTVEFTKAAFNARDTDFVPAAMKDAVIASTGLAGPGETVEVTFKVPAKAGTYAFVCSFPGHFALGMRGTLIVK
jgi:azurin